jgi:hypothetical protein
VILNMSNINGYFYTTSPATAPVTLRYEKGVVGTNLLRLIKIGGPSQTRTGDLTIMSRML